MTSCPGFRRPSCAVPSSSDGRGQLGHVDGGESQLLRRLFGVEISGRGAGSAAGFTRP